MENLTFLTMFGLFLKQILKKFSKIQKILFCPRQACTEKSKAKKDCI